MHYALVPEETWRELFWQEALRLIGQLTSAGSDPAKVTATLHAIEAHNATRAAVKIVDQPPA